MTHWDLPPDASIKDRLFAALAVPLTVDEIEEATGLARAQIQNNLGYYKARGDVTCDRDGRYVRSDPTWAPKAARSSRASAPAGPPSAGNAHDTLAAHYRPEYSPASPITTEPPSIPDDPSTMSHAPRQKINITMPDVEVPAGTLAMAEEFARRCTAINHERSSPDAAAVQVMLFPRDSISADDRAQLRAAGIVAVETDNPDAVTILWPHATHMRGIDGYDLLVAAIEALASDAVGMTGARVRFMEGLLKRVKGAGADNAGA